MALYRYNGATWRKVKNVYRKTTPESYTGTPASNFTDSSKHWRRHAAFYYKKANGSWARVHTKTSTGVVFTTAPAIHTYGGASNPYGPNDGITVSSPRTLNTVLYGKDGIWTPRNEISITRNFQASATPDGASRFVIDSNDIFDLSTASSQIQSDADESYLYYRISVTNFGDTTTASAGPLFLIKDYPQWNSFGTGTTAPIVGNTLTFTYNMQNYYYNRIERANSVIEWWRSPTTDAEGTLIKSTLVSDTNITTNNSTSLQGTDTYVIDSADSGYYVVAKMKVVNSWTRYYNDNNYYSSDPTTAKVSGPISFSNTRVEDSQGNSGVDNYFGVPTATSLRFRTTVSNVNSGTTYRVRYRYYNFQSNAITSWTTYTANSSGVGDISSVSISNGVATISDSFTIDSSTYNGSTYGGGLARWGIEMEVAAIKSGTTTTDYLVYDIHAAPTPTLTALPVSGNPPLNVTFSGSISGTPSPYISYPKSYTINFGDGTTPYTGTFSYGVGNPTFSGISHTYSSTGTYYPSITTIPHYTTAYSETVIAATSPDIPTGLSGSGIGSANLQQISLSWNTANNASTYDLYYNGTGTTPSDSFAGDYTGIATNSFTTPYASYSANTTYYWWVRSVSSNGLKSAWSSRATVVTNTESYTVTWNANGGSVSPTSATFTTGGYVVAPTATRTGYSLNGWYDTQVLDWNYFVSAGNLFYPPSRNITMYARWSVALPGTPNSLSATTTRTDGVNLTFSGSSGATSYDIFWNTASSGTPSSAATPDFTGVTSPYLDTTISGGVTRYYWVRGRNDYGVSAWYPASTGVAGTRTVAIPLPSTPTGLSATTNRTTDVYLSWNASSYATTYEIWWGGPPSDSSTPDFYPGSATYYFDNSISQGSSRTYYVRARNATGASSWSGGVTGTRANPVVVVNPPTGLSINLSYSSGPSWSGSWSASGATSYSWTFYTADNSSGGGMTFRSSGSGTSMSYSGGTQIWGKVYVTATNSGGSVSGESAWT